jgi:hypothetical protein
VRQKRAADQNARAAQYLPAYKLILTRRVIRAAAYAQNSLPVKRLAKQNKIAAELTAKIAARAKKLRRTAGAASAVTAQSAVYAARLITKTVN